MMRFVNEWTLTGWEIHNASLRDVLRLKDGEQFHGMEPDCDYPEPSPFIRKFTHECPEGQAANAAVVVYEQDTRTYPRVIPYIIVDIWVNDTCISSFIVSIKICDAFMASEIPKLMQQITFPELQISLSGLLKAFAAYVRHGHGIKTISACGAFNKEDSDFFGKNKKIRPKS